MCSLEDYHYQLLEVYEAYTDDDLREEIGYWKNKITYSDAYMETSRYNKELRQLQYVLNLRRKQCLQ